MDKNKCGLPTTESQAKCLAKMQRIKSKLTGVQLFKDDSLVFFRTLPDVPTGGNLTLTIVAHLFGREDVRNATDVYINVDGASDNICYHFVYGMAFLLRCSNLSGWPLRRIHLLRFKVCLYKLIILYNTRTHSLTHSLTCLFQVGHTHNQLDGTFGCLSRHVYGSQRGGVTSRDLLSFSGFDAVSVHF